MSKKAKPGKVWGASCLTPEMLQAKAEENARQALKIELRERTPPNIFYSSDWKPSGWTPFVAPFYETLRNIWRYLRGKD